MDPLRDLRDRLHRVIWDESLASRPRWQRSAIGFARLAAAIGRDLSSGALTLRAMSLVFTTLLALVPFIAVSFSVLKGFGVHNRVEPVLLRFLAPLGPRANEITDRVVGFVDNIKVGVLGAVGVALLLYTAVSLVQKIEEAFNYTWNVGRRRTLVRQFSDYFSVIVIGPLLVFLALGITASLSSSAVVQAILAIEPFGSLVRLGTRLLPYVLLITAFTFIYLLIPNTRVRFRAALFGGVVAGIAWETLGRLFATFIVTSTNYTAIYSGFAILLLFMIWLYLSWLVLLTGSAVAFYRQFPGYLAVGGRAGVRLSPAQAESVGLAVATAIASAWYSGAAPPHRDAIAERLGAPAQPIDRALEALLDAGLITQAGRDGTGHLPARPPERTSVKAVIDAVRHHGERSGAAWHGGGDPRCLAALDEALERALGGTTLAELAEAGTAREAEEAVLLAAGGDGQSQG